MNNYVKTVIYTALVVAYTAWHVTCIAPQSVHVQIHNARAASSASSSFIQQESGAIPSSSLSSNKSVNTRPSSNQNTQHVSQQIPQRTNSTNTQTLRPSNTRDYVNPNRATPQGTQNIPRPTTSSPVRTNPSFSPSSQPRRDYVNPQFVNQNPSPTQRTITTTPKLVATNPTKSNSRDFVSPRPKPDFPPLPKSRGTTAPPGQNVGSTVISYAQKVSGNAITQAPIAVGANPTNISSATGSPSNPTTKAPPEEGPTDTELRDFSEAILRRDVNNAAKYVTINIQGKTTSQSQNDEAPAKLLQVNPEAFQIPTISKLLLLHNNYILEVTENEHVTPQEKAEENELLDAILSTPIMQYTRNYLISKNKLSRDPKDFRDLLKRLWFSMYSRGAGKIGSSAFEHIFLAELKKQEVSGLHNWLYFDQAENNNLVDYLGYMKKIDLGEKGAILKYHFKLNGVDKPVNSMFIGTSPELEIALYTTCYVFRADRVCPLRLAGHNFVVRTYTFRYRGTESIGSAFPEI